MSSPPYSVSEANAINVLRYEKAVAQARVRTLSDSLIAALKSLEEIADEADRDAIWYQTVAKIAIDRIAITLDKYSKR